MTEEHHGRVDAEADGDDLLNLKQVARLLGVHYMTAYRYVRHGRLPAHQERSMWWVRRANLEEFRASPTPQAANVDWASRLSGLLGTGDEVAAWAVLRDARNSGTSFEAVHLDVLARAVALVPGGENSVGHRLAVNTATRLVARLGGDVTHRGRKLGSVILAAPRGEHHGLALGIVANLVRHGGFRVVELGTDVGAEDLLAAVEMVEDPVAVCVSVTTGSCWDEAVALVESVAAVHPGMPVLLGGQAVANPEVAAVTGATAWSAGPDLNETLVGLARARRREAVGS